MRFESIRRLLLRFLLTIRRRFSTTSSWVHRCRQCSATEARPRCSPESWRCSVACSARTAGSRSSTWDANSRRPERLFAVPARQSRAACTTTPPTSSAARDVAPPPRRLTCGQKRERYTPTNQAAIAANKWDDWKKTTARLVGSSSSERSLFLEKWS